MTFLGYVISKEVIKVDSQKVKAAIGWPRPTSVSNVHSFLGMVGNYRQGIGFVLMQDEKVIAYASRQPKLCPKNDLTYDLELDMDVLALKMWRHYLYGRFCKIFTNHENLKYIFTQKELNLRQHRWLELLKDYDLQLQYHPMRANLVANALSHKTYYSVNIVAMVRSRF